MNIEARQQRVKTGHVALNVSDVGRSERFYREVFGLEVIQESETEGRRFVFLGEEDRIVLTLWQQSEGRFEKAAPGLHHLSFQVDSIEETRAAEARLRLIGAPLIYGGVVPHSEGAEAGGSFFDNTDANRPSLYTTHAPAASPT